MSVRAPAALVLPFAVAAALSGCSSSPAAEEAPASAGARLYDGFGNYARPITTSSPEAQRWFDQGLQLLYGFNHDEAIRSFARAAELDPGCAMASWGVAYAHGLHINNPAMSEKASNAAWAASREALARLDDESPVEQALVRAVAQRYAQSPPEDRTSLDETYAAAMGEAFHAFPLDPDVGALYAESLMNLQPWDLWTHAGEPKGRTLEIVAVLEEVLARHPRHPGANHFYIHTVEASREPERALAAAEALSDLVPGSGHLVHMPSHIWIRTGDYVRAAQTNARAIAADGAYFAVAPAPDFYSLYFVHNIHFLAYASMMNGDRASALEAAEQLERELPPEFVENYVRIADGLTPLGLHVYIRFGDWREILRVPDYPEHRLAARAMRHYARALALANLGETAAARREQDAFERVAAQMDESWSFGNNPAPSVLAIAGEVIEGEILFKQGERTRGIERLQRAAELEDEQIYDEPPG
ncbi:MAG TPA: hypothetical protein VMT18_02425, partial [Planctomycetota bacterium]|nr:hypothetical protein [Planctomycetota bacterium]